MAQHNPHDPDELVAVVDAQDRVVGQATRRQVHDKGLLHREAGVIVVDGRGGVLLQRRVDNGLWALSAAGHFPADESYEEGAVREAREELGVELDREELRLVFAGRITATGRNDRFVKVFAVRRDLPASAFPVDRGEVLEVRWFTKNEVLALGPDHMRATNRAWFVTEVFPFLEKNHKL